MLKVGAIVLVVVGLILLFGLIYISFKMLRQTQQQQRDVGNSKQYKIHPKLQQQRDKQQQDKQPDV